ncbi:MAG: hypothetical protein SO057_07220 [Atopobiaceae bacterium]|nr:hypothetical protein [Atopobiaceae bacterium]
MPKMRKAAPEGPEVPALLGPGIPIEEPQDEGAGGQEAAGEPMEGVV